MYDSVRTHRGDLGVARDEQHRAIGKLGRVQIEDIDLQRFRLSDCYCHLLTEPEGLHRVEFDSRAAVRRRRAATCTDRGNTWRESNQGMIGRDCGDRWIGRRPMDPARGQWPR